MNKTVGMRMVLVGMLAGALLSGCANDRPARVYEPLPYSSVIDGKVQRLLAADPLLKGRNLKVNTFQGKVKLDGVVDTEAQRQQAAKLAWGVTGVRAVENNIVLRSEQTPSTQGMKSK